MDTKLEPGAHNVVHHFDPSNEKFLRTFRVALCIAAVVIGRSRMLVGFEAVSGGL
jgi:hypothetical protein